MKVQKNILMHIWKQLRLRLISANQISFRFITRKISSYLYPLFLHSRTYIKFCIILMMIFD